VVNIVTVVNKKKVWKDRYRGKQDLIFTVVNKKKTWKDRYHGKQLCRGKQEKGLERSLPW